MIRNLLISLCLCSACLNCLTGQDIESAESFWHHFRGPTLNGDSPTATPPVEWSDTKNVAWKVEIPGSGTGSPIVWGNLVFVVTAVPVESQNSGRPAERLTNEQLRDRFDVDRNGRLSDEERNAAREFLQEQRRRSIRPQQFMVMCFNRQDGSRVWAKTAVEAKPHDGHHQDHGYASASPVTDGERLYVSFGSQGIFCYDLDGQLVWKRTDLGKMKTRGGFGEGSSLGLHGDYLILPWDHEGPSRIEVINKHTGETKWKTDRDEPSNWVTPRVVTVNSRPQIIQAGENFTRGYDLETGEEVWKASGLSTRPVASPTVRNNVAYFASSRGGAALNAYYLDRRGDISDDGFAWKNSQFAPDCPSLLLSENRLFVLSGNNGILSCLNADDGAAFYSKQRLRRIEGVYSSPVSADGRVYITGRNGKTLVIKDSNEFQVLANNDIGEPVDATLALVDNQIFIRGKQHLFCIESPNRP